MGDVTLNFSRSESRSKSQGGAVPYPEDWVEDRLRPGYEMLEVIRAEAGRPLYIISGYRTPQHNINVGGARNSLHVQGRAWDISYTARPWETSGEEVHAMHAMILRLHAEGKLPLLGGLGVYPKSGWCHVDCRYRAPGVALARWSGAGVGSEVTA